MWVLAHSICLPAPEAESLPIVCSDIELLAQSRSKVIHEKFCLHGSLTEAYLHSLSGMTLQPSELTTQIHEATSSGCEKGARNSSFVAGSRSCARTLAQLGRERDSKESEADCGQKWLGSFVRYDQELSLWKTHQCSFLGELEVFSGTWPTWGTMHDGECWEVTMPELPTRENASGLLPTPTASNTKAHHMRGNDKGKAREARSYGAHGPLNPVFLEWHMGWVQEWSELKPLETVKFQEWLKQHGGF